LLKYSHNDGLEHKESESQKVYLYIH
jgi:hypothetical protein